MKKLYNSPELEFCKFSFEKLLEEQDEPLITPSGDEYVSNQGGEYQGDLG